MDDWKGLALLLDLASSRIETECAQESSGARHECYRRSLIRRYCDKCPSGSPEEVAEQIAQVLEEKMGHKRQAQQLRELRFSESAMRQCKFFYLCFNNYNGIYSLLKKQRESLQCVKSYIYIKNYYKVV